MQIRSPMLLVFLVPLPQMAIGADAPTPAAEYSAELTSAPHVLSVDAKFAPGGSDSLEADEAIARFVRQPRLEVAGKWVPARLNGSSWLVSGCRKNGCHIRYQLMLTEAATALDDFDTATISSHILLSPVSAWLITPRNAEPTGLVRLKMTTPAGIHFVTSLFPSADKSPDNYQGTLEGLSEAPLAAWGDFDLARVDSAGSPVDVVFSSNKWPVPRASLIRWVETSATAVSRYYHRFPVPKVLLFFRIEGAGHIGGGTTRGNGGASILVTLGNDLSESDLKKDWVLTHEMVHLAFPSMPPAQHWLEEGIATYVEPIARARLGTQAADEVWRWAIWGLPKGQPEAGDEGLDNTSTWGRTYWGGALFCFVADITIREQTQNRFSLDDALRAIVVAGGSIAVSWPIERTLEIGDRATGTHVLVDLYRRMRASPSPVDLDSYWKRLGVSTVDGHVRYDDRAPLAAIRKSITQPYPSGVAP